MECLYSPFVIFFAFLLLAGALAPLQWVGAGLILLAVLIVSRHKPPEKRTRAQLIAGILIGAADMACMGFGIVIAKPILDTYSVVWASLIRMVGGTVFLFVIVLALPHRKTLFAAFRPSRVWKFTLPGAVSGAYFSLILWIAGFKYADASVAAILNQTNTIFALVLAALILKESFTRRKLAAVVIAMAGVVLVILYGGS